MKWSRTTLLDEMRSSPWHKFAEELWDNKREREGEGEGKREVYDSLWKEVENFFKKIKNLKELEFKVWKVKRFLFFCLTILTCSNVTVSDTDRVSVVDCIGKWEWESEIGTFKVSDMHLIAWTKGEIILIWWHPVILFWGALESWQLHFMSWAQAHGQVMI